MSRRRGCAGLCPPEGCWRDDCLVNQPAEPECDRLHCNDTIGPCDDCPRGREMEAA